MTQNEYKKCTGLMIQAIASANRSNEAFNASSNMNLSDVNRNVQELIGQNSLGYAEGINQALVAIGFKHERMSELSKLI